MPNLYGLFRAAFKADSTKQRMEGKAGEDSGRGRLRAKAGEVKEGDKYLLVLFFFFLVRYQC